MWLHTWSLFLLLVFLMYIGWFIFNSRTFIGVVESEIIFHSLNNMQDKCKILKNATRKSWKWASSLTDWSCNEETVVVLFEMHQILYQLYLPILAALLIKGEVLNCSITDTKLESILWTGGRQCMGKWVMWMEWHGAAGGEWHCIANWWKVKVHWLRGCLDTLLLNYGEHSWGTHKISSFLKIKWNKICSDWVRWINCKPFVHSVLFL